MLLLTVRFEFDEAYTPRRNEEMVRKNESFRFVNIHY